MSFKYAEDDYGQVQYIPIYNQYLSPLRFNNETGYTRESNVTTPKGFVNLIYTRK